MFNLSPDFLIKGKINKELRQEFLDNYLSEFWNYLGEEIEGCLRVFSSTTNRYVLLGKTNKTVDKTYEEIRELSLKEQKEYLKQFQRLGWKGLRPTQMEVPDYRIIQDWTIKEMIDYLNNTKDNIHQNKKIALKFLVFLNDKKVVYFPLVLSKYPYLAIKDQFLQVQAPIDKEIQEEYLFVHKNENHQTGQILRSYEGDWEEFSKEGYEATINYVEKNELSNFRRVLYTNFIDTIFYVACRKRKDLDPDFVINRYTAAGEWFSFDFLKNFDGMLYYKEEMEKFLTNYDLDPGKARNALRHFIKYLVSLEEKPRWTDFNRIDHIFDPQRKNKTLLSYIQKMKVSDVSWNLIVGQMYKFFDFLKSKGFIVNNPIFPREDYRTNKTNAKNGTHRKSLSEEIIQEAKLILRENDFQFPRKCGGIETNLSKIFNHKTQQYDENIWSPSVVIALYTLLEIPIRGIQVQLLDSGEGDEQRYCFNEKKVIKNIHPLTEKGRSEGFIRKSGYETFDGEFYSLWITTNKSISDGYEIPYLSDEFYEILKVQYEFLEKYDPNPIKVHKGELIRTSLVKKYPMFYPLFRDLSSRKKLILPKRKIEVLWGLVCREVEKRFQERGINISLTKNNKNGGLRSKYDIHSLRVTGITNLLDKGVPLNLVSKYFAGHSSFAMTLWYNSPHPKKLREHLEKAKNNTIKNGEWNFSDMEQELISNDFTGNKHLLVENQGSLSIGISGICPYKRCDEGGDFEPRLNKHKAVPMGANGPNCFGCRFFITGPKFLIGQMIEGNMLIRNIQKKIKFLDELKEKIMDAEDNKELNKSNILKGQKRVEEESYKNMLQEWWSRMKTFEASRKMMDNNQNSLVVYGEEVKPMLKEMDSFEVLHNITTFGEFFPEFVNFKEPFMELENLLSKFLMKNEISPFILSLDGQEKVKACNLMGDLLLSMGNQYDLDSLLDGKILLKDIPQLQGKINKILEYTGVKNESK